MSIAWENTVETLEFSSDPTINQKIKSAVTGLQKNVQKMFLEFPTEHDKEQVADFILMSIKQENVANDTKRICLIALAYLSRYFDNKKSFDDMTSVDLANYVNSYQKSRSEDPDQSWIGTQRALGLPLLKFFKWLAYPELTPQQRSTLPRDKYPKVLQGVVLQTKKGSKTPRKQKEIWDDKDTAIFLKYCTDNPRLRFYHALAYETSARPSELLQLKIGDIEIQTADDNGKLFSLVDIGRFGKKKQSRIVGITDFTIQYLQPYLSSQHPDSTNRKAYLFVSREHGAALKNIALSVDALRKDYKAFQNIKIPKLLKRPDISEEDKKHLQFMKETKKWFPYIVRHSSLSKLAPNVSEYRLREQAGWSKRSDMVEVYTHTLVGDSAEDILMLYGVNLKDGKKKRNEKLQQEMVGPQCPFCHMTNIPNTQLCSSCHKPLTSISYNKIIQEAEERKKELEWLRQEQRKFDDAMKLVVAKLHQIDNFVRGQNTVLCEATTEMGKYLTEKEREEIQKELQEENEQVAREGKDINELLRMELRRFSGKT